jgi:hypothetical protein
MLAVTLPSTARSVARQPAGSRLRNCSTTSGPPNTYAALSKTE